jgi:hypothetical protein
MVLYNETEVRIIRNRIAQNLFSVAEGAFFLNDSIKLTICKALGRNWKIR